MTFRVLLGHLRMFGTFSKVLVSLGTFWDGLGCFWTLRDVSGNLRKFSDD